MQVLTARTVRNSTLAFASALNSRTDMPPSSQFDSEAMSAASDNSNVLFFACGEKDAAAPKVAAVLGIDGGDRNRVCELLGSLGYEAVSFGLREELVASLRYRHRCFDLLVASLDGNGRELPYDAQALRSSIGPDVPLLLMMRETQLYAAAASASAAKADFILAPCNPLEFEARLAGQRTSATAKDEEREFRCGSYHFYPIGRTVHFWGKRIRLKPLEFDLARRLFRNPSIIHSRQTLFQHVWEHVPHNRETRTIDIHVASLRKKLDLGPDREFDLRVVFNVGYQLMFQD